MRGEEFAESLLEESIQDLQTYKTEIPDFYKNSFQTDIITSLRINSPVLFKENSKKYDLKEDEYIQGYKSISEFGNVGTVKAVENIKKSLASQDASSNKMALVFIIKELLAANKTKEANSILELILASEEDSDTTSYLLLLFLKENYTSQTVRFDLQKRFLKFIVAAGMSILQKPSLDALDLKRRQIIYDILKNSLSKVETLLPADFSQALSVTDNLRKNMSETFREREDINERISQSKDKLGQTILEAEKTADKNLKDSLWEQAAWLALREKKFQLAVDCIEKVEAGDENFLLRHDQFLDNDVIESALKEKDLDSAEYALAKIKSKHRFGIAMLQIVKFHYKNKDILNAQLTLNESLREIQATDNDAQKVRGLSDILSIAFVVDKESLFSIYQSIIKTVNSLPSPNDTEKSESEARKKYVEDVEMVIAWSLFPAFQRLAKYNSAFARNMTFGFTERKYRLVCLAAAEIGTFEAQNLIKENENKKVTSKQ